MCHFDLQLYPHPFRHLHTPISDSSLPSFFHHHDLTISPAPLIPLPATPISTIHTHRNPRNPRHPAPSHSPHPKRPSKDVWHLITNAANNADILHGIEEDQLMVKECYVNKGKFLKRIEFKGRGRIGIRHKPYSHLTVVVEEVR